MNNLHLVLLLAGRDVIGIYGSGEEDGGDVLKALQPFLLHRARAVHVTKSENASRVTMTL